MPIYFVKFYDNNGKIQAATLANKETLFSTIQKFPEGPQEKPKNLEALPPEGMYSWGETDVDGKTTHPWVEWEPDDAPDIRRCIRVVDNRPEACP